MSGAAWGCERFSVATIAAFDFYIGCILKRSNIYRTTPRTSGIYIRKNADWWIASEKVPFVNQLYK
jgi:hypothetical protein